MRRHASFKNASLVQGLNRGSARDDMRYAGRAQAITYRTRIVVAEIAVVDCRLLGKNRTAVELFEACKKERGVGLP